ncbi:MAG: 50S ribosomal protein L3 [Candidatus Babeliaceae bacterium]|jgi:large subunit ribosomal protein L3
MANGLWGKKIGMTQVFAQDNKVVPVTVIDVADWFVTQIKTKERDGYDAIQLGCVKKQFSDKPFSSEWLRSPRKYFSVFKEVHIDESETPSLGQPADISLVVGQGDYVDVFGITIGRGFQGGVKRHGFTGGVASHGSKLGRGPGSLSFMRSQGRVIKGQRMAGHMGTDKRVMKNLKIIKVQPEAKVIFVKGSVPGKSGSLVFVRKRG